MANPMMQGRIDTDTLKRMVANDEIDTVIATFPDMYGRLVGKRITGRFFVDEVFAHGMHACDYLLACDMDMEPVPGYAFTSWAKGYGDFRPLPDFSTLRIASWLPKTALVLCDVYQDKKDALVPLAPRSMLKQQLSRADEMGFSAMAASELELYVFKDSYETVADKGFIRATPIGRVIEDYHILQGTKEEFLIGAIRSHMERAVPKNRGTEFVDLMEELTHDTCVAGPPDCPSCELRKICPTGQERMLCDKAATRSAAKHKPAIAPPPPAPPPKVVAKPAAAHPAPIPTRLKPTAKAEAAPLATKIAPPKGNPPVPAPQGKLPKGHIPKLK